MSAIWRSTWFTAAWWHWLDIPINRQFIENENDPVGPSEVVPVNRIVGAVVVSCWLLKCQKPPWINQIFMPTLLPCNVWLFSATVRQACTCSLEQDSLWSSRKRSCAPKVIENGACKSSYLSFPSMFTASFEMAWCEKIYNPIVSQLLELI